jgi:hypothetical protein
LLGLPNVAPALLLREGLPALLREGLPLAAASDADLRRTENAFIFVPAAELEKKKKGADAVRDGGDGVAGSRAVGPTRDGCKAPAP